ncbi:MAG: hypothetical protein ACYTGH_05020 [Planctomycetota bacterium]|jgi:hypothetical protein
MTAEYALANDGLEVVLESPGHPQSYAGVRFCRAGIPTNVTWHGRQIFGPWREESVQQSFHDAVAGMAGEFDIGFAGLPTPPGYDCAAPGDAFLKIGVGVLRRRDEEDYGFDQPYELIDSAPWTVREEGAAVEMVHAQSLGEHGYHYVYRLELRDNQTFTVTHILRNTGAAALHQTHYNHNFLTLGGERLGPGLELELPFAPEAVSEMEVPFAFEGGAISVARELEEAFFSSLSGFGESVQENRVVVRDRRIGLELTMVGDFPLHRFHLFATPRTLCPEPFIELNLNPGEERSWSHSYVVSEI